MNNIITKIETQKNNSKRVSIFIDNKFAFGIYKKTLYKFDLNKGDKIDENLRQEIMLKDEYSDCINKSYSLLSYKDRTTNELKEKLLNKEFNINTINKVIKKLKDLRYLDDYEYAKRYIDFKIEKMGSYKIKNKLLKKGVNERIISELLNEYSQEFEFKKALKLAKKRNEKYENISYKKRYQRVSGYLKRKGYSYDIINSVLEDVLYEYKEY
ncbi:MAG: RecX family transcriptional regulator [Bacillota bacterium]